MSTLKFPAGPLSTLRHRSPARDKAHKAPSGNCAAAPISNMTRRKSLSVSDISSLSLSPGGRGPRQRVPENDLGRQSKSAQSSQSSLLGGTGVKEAGGRSLGGSIGDFMNSGEFRPAGAGWSPRTCSPITLSMVNEGVHRSDECLHVLPPTISLDQPDADTRDHHHHPAARPAGHKPQGELDHCRRNMGSRSSSPKYVRDIRPEATDAPDQHLRNSHRDAQYFEHNVIVPVDVPQLRRAPPDPAPPHQPAQDEEQDSEEPESGMRAGRHRLQRNSKKKSMVERTQHLALLLHDQNQRSRREAVVLPVRRWLSPSPVPHPPSPVPLPPLSPVILRSHSHYSHHSLHLPSAPSITPPWEAGVCVTL